MAALFKATYSSVVIGAGNRSNMYDGAIKT